MKKSEVQNIIESLIPEVYTYSFLLSGSESQAKELIIDAVSVITLKEREELEQITQDGLAKNVQKIFKQDMKENLLKEIWFLYQKRSADLKSQHLSFFYELEPLQRSLVVLKEKMALSWEALVYIHQMKKHHLLEKLYQARQSLLAEKDEFQMEGGKHA